MRTLTLLLVAAFIGLSTAPALVAAQDRTTTTRATRSATPPSTGVLKDGASYAIKRGKLFVNDKLAVPGRYVLKSGDIMVFDGTNINVDRASANPTPHPVK